MHGLDLLFSLSFCIFQSLVFLLDALNFAFNFLLPVALQVYLSLMVVGFKLSDFLKLGFLLNF